MLLPHGSELTFPQQALAHPWLSGENASDHNLLPEIRAYMAKARLRRGIEIVKLANRIEALKMQEDEHDDTEDQADVPADAKAAAGSALPDADHEGAEAKTAGGSHSGGKKSLSNIAKGAIFREVVMAKVREAKEQEHALQVEKEAQDRAQKTKSFQDGV
jgi:calcium/calmodulin-dependent protein kinase I